MCLTCWLKKRAQAVLGDREGWRALLDLWERQGGRCAYTGRVLTPGQDASLDHIVPRSKGGSNHPHNLQWVSAAVNTAKQDLSENEFLNLCAQVVAYRQGSI